MIVHTDDAKTDHILRQTDFEARWTKKNNQSYFGYKDHIAVDKTMKFIMDYDVTSAEVHDSQRIDLSKHSWSIGRFCVYV